MDGEIEIKIVTPGGKSHRKRLFMTKSVCSFVLITLFVFCSIAKESEKDNKIKKLMSLQGPPLEFVPKEGFIPNESTAVKIAELLLAPILKKDLKQELPLKAIKIGNVWIVEGRERLVCNKNEKNCFQLDGSPVHIEIDARDGRVIKLYKFK